MNFLSVSTVMGQPVVEWSKAFGGENEDWAHSVIQTEDSGYLISGHTLSFGAGWFDALLVKTDSEGDGEWSKTYGSEDFDWARSIVR